MAARESFQILGDPPELLKVEELSNSATSGVALKWFHQTMTIYEDQNAPGGRSLLPNPLRGQSL